MASRARVVFDYWPVFVNHDDALVPEQTAQTLRDILAETREDAGTAGIISLVLLLFSGSNLFATMQMVFNLAYHVEDRNIVVQRVVAVVMLLLVTALLLVSTAAYGAGSLIGVLGIAAPAGAVLGRIAGWSVSISSAFVMFLLLFKVLPNRHQSWQHILPGILASAALFFVILQVFPLYLAIFGKGFAAFATAARAEKGQVHLRWRRGAVQAFAIASARTADGESQPGHHPPVSDPDPREVTSSRRPQLGASGRLIGLVGLLGAALLLRGYWIAAEPGSVRH